MSKATVVFVQFPVSSLGKVIKAIKTEAELAKRASWYEYEGGNTLKGDSLVRESNNLHEIAMRIERKLNSVTIRNGKGK